MTTIGPGTRVRCINDAWDDGDCPVKPVLGSTWTVKLVWRAGDIVVQTLLGADYLSFEEIGLDDLYRMDRFIPIDDLNDLRELAREAKNPDAPARKRELI